MPLIDLTTNLRDLKFGRDRVAGGSSNQPYVQSDIPAPDKESSGLGYLNQDFVVRGGLKAVVNSVKDVERLSKYFFDIRNPSGLLFIAKQNLLSRLAVKTQASGKLNEGTYTPIGTLAQAGDVAFGLHTNKQGLNPFENFRVGAGATDPTSLGGYFFAVTDTNTDKLSPTTKTSTTTTIPFSFTPTSIVNDIEGIGGGIKTYNISTTTSTITTNKRNRLLELYNDLLISENIPFQLDVRSYSGGPGSILGIGKTNIKFATGNGTNDVRTGKNNIELKNLGFFTSQGESNYKYSVFTTPLLRSIEEKQIPLGVSLDIASSFPLGTPPYVQDEIYFDRRTSIISSETKAEEFTSKDKRGTIDGQIASNEPQTYLYTEILNIPDVRDKTVKPSGSSIYIGEIGLTTPGDFRALLRSKNFPEIPFAPDYTEKNIEAKLGDPGNRNGKDLQLYDQGAGNGTTIPVGAASFNSYDKINASDIDDNNKDLISFKIEKIDNNNPSSTNTIQFRAFLDSITDSFSAEWKGERYVGRGENFYTYSGFDRKVSLGWTVAAQSKAELIPMYKKLSYLASICAPDYSSKGYMRGNIVKLTIGGYFFQQPGIITGFSYEMNEDNATWEIGIDSVGDDDDTTSQLPHLIKVKGFQFIPIHTFVPELGIWENSPFIAISPPSKNKKQ